MGLRRNFINVNIYLMLSTACEGQRRVTLGYLTSLVNDEQVASREARSAPEIPVLSRYKAHAGTAFLCGESFSGLLKNFIDRSTYSSHRCRLALRKKWQARAMK
ncbi:hypothetical protein BU16DRAFT_94150 [Lophium mytilinum]|uniref:Uncharacterized protein n=1 Tax=Lophium mytilinum TaxID=390894 RepID=A0A6A6QLK3_9PEZI|nr:hypothetical protein BU16DRAFT_94150 [Lophium mytilinum]